MPEKRTRGAGQFAKGTSGNPAGRPPGSRNHATLLMESLLEEEAETLTAKLLNWRKEGTSPHCAFAWSEFFPSAETGRFT